MQKYKENSLQDLIQKYPDYIIAIKTGYFYSLCYESAKIINEIFGYKLFDKQFKKFSRIETGFPEQSLESVVEELRLRNLKFIIVKDYEIIDKNENGEGILPNFENNYNNKLTTKCSAYVVVDVDTGIIEKIEVDSIFGKYFINKKVGDTVEISLRNNHLVTELKVIDAPKETISTNEKCNNKIRNVAYDVLDERLTSYRQTEAEMYNIPKPYFVFTNKAKESILNARNNIYSKEDILGLHGWGPYKVNHYGDDIIKILNDIDQNYIE